MYDTASLSSFLHEPEPHVNNHPPNDVSVQTDFSLIFGGVCPNLAYRKGLSLGYILHNESVLKSNWSREDFQSKKSKSVSTASTEIRSFTDDIYREIQQHLDFPHLECSLKYLKISVLIFVILGVLFFKTIVLFLRDMLMPNSTEISCGH